MPLINQVARIIHLHEFGYNCADRRNGQLPDGQEPRRTSLEALLTPKDPPMAQELDSDSRALFDMPRIDSWDPAPDTAAPLL